MVHEQVQLRTNRRLVSTVINHMRQVSKPRYLQYKACRLFTDTQKLSYQRQAFSQWSQTAKFFLQMSQVTGQLDQYRRTLYLRKTFKAFKQSSRAKKARRCLYSALLEKSLLLRKQTILSELFNICKQSKAYRQNKEVAFSYRHDKLRRTSFQSLYTHSLVSRRSKCLVGAALFQRLIPKAFACLQMHRKSSQVKKALKQKSDGLRAKILFQKSFKTLGIWI